MVLASCILLELVISSRHTHRIYMLLNTLRRGGKPHELPSFFKLRCLERDVDPEALHTVCCGEPNKSIFPRRVMMVEEVFSIGKHKNKTFSEVAREQPDYVKWVLSQANPNGQLRLFVDYLRRKEGGNREAKTEKNESSSPFVCGNPSRAASHTPEAANPGFDESFQRLQQVNGSQAFKRGRDDILGVDKDSVGFSLKAEQRGVCLGDETIDLEDFKYDRVCEQMVGDCTNGACEEMLDMHTESQHMPTDRWSIHADNGQAHAETRHTHTNTFKSRESPKTDTFQLSANCPLLPSQRTGNAVAAFSSPGDSFSWKEFENIAESLDLHDDICKKRVENSEARAGWGKRQQVKEGKNHSEGSMTSNPTILKGFLGNSQGISGVEIDAKTTYEGLKNPPLKLIDSSKMAHFQVELSPLYGPLSTGFDIRGSAHIIASETLSSTEKLEDFSINQLPSNKDDGFEDLSLKDFGFLDTFSYSETVKKPSILPTTSIVADMGESTRLTTSPGLANNYAVAHVPSSSLSVASEDGMQNGDLKRKFQETSSSINLSEVQKPAKLQKIPLTIKLALEINSTTSFRIVAFTRSGKNPSVGRWSHFLPQVVRNELQAFSPLGAQSDAKHSFLRFSAAKYDAICQALMESFLCELELVPSFILRSFPKFVEYAKSQSLPKKTAFILMGETSEDTAIRRKDIDFHLGEILTRELKPFQLEGVNFGLKKDGRVLIGDEMGLGKTLQALAIAAFYSDDWPVLVVCPSSIRFQWRDQAKHWLPHKITPEQICVVRNGKTKIPYGTLIVIISYDLLAMHKHFQVGYKSIICDESHYLKNQQAKRTQAVSPMLRRARRAILLSGTPALNKPIELYQQLDALIPDFGNYREFAERYCENQMNWFTKRMEYVGHKHTDELHLFLKHTVMIRRLKKDVQMELPPKLRSRIPVEVSDKEMKEIRLKMAELQSAEVLEAENSNVEMLATSPQGDRKQSQITELFTLTGKAKMKGAAEHIAYMIQCNCKFLVFAHHKEMLDTLENQTIKEKANYIRIDGRTNQDKRELYVHRFQSDPNCTVALLSITACSQGLNLTAAGTVVFAELYWVPGQIIQAEDRCHRMGTEYSSIDVHYLIAEDTLDETVWRTLNKKWGIMTSTLDGTEQSLSAQQMNKSSLIFQMQAKKEKRLNSPVCVD